MFQSIKEFVGDESGVTAIEYALIASLICLCVVSLLTPKPSEAKLRPFTE